MLLLLGTACPGVEPGPVLCTPESCAGCCTDEGVCKTACPAPDAGGRDAGAVDAGPVDAGAPDAGSTDAGPVDAGSVDAGSTDAGVAGRDGGYQVHVFLFTSLRTCFIGPPCDGGACLNLRDDQGTLLKAFSESGFASVPTTDSRVAAAPYKQCMEFPLEGTALATRKSELAVAAAQVDQWTDGGIRWDLTLHELTADVSLQQWGSGFWLAPWNIESRISPMLPRSVDFILTLQGNRDRATGWHFDVGGCGGTLGVQYGIRGAPYSWVPQTRPGNSFECSDHGVYVHEWLHQVESAMFDVMRFMPLYTSMSFPACGMTAADRSLWFPSTHDCQTDPDSPSCGAATCMGGNDAANGHVLQAHWPPSRRMLPNHCRDGRQDFGETGIDVGGRCAP